MIRRSACLVTESSASVSSEVVRHANQLWLRRAAQRHLIAQLLYMLSFAARPLHALLLVLRLLSLPFSTAPKGTYSAHHRALEADSCAMGLVVRQRKRTRGLLGLYVQRRKQSQDKGLVFTRTDPPLAGYGPDNVEKPRLTSTKYGPHWVATRIV